MTDAAQHTSELSRVDDRYTQPTAVIDYLSEPVQELFHRLQNLQSSGLGYLRAVHASLRREVLPVYTVDELQPASITLRKHRGSCSQRFACLEAVARAAGIATRVRALWIAGRFWARRFPVTRGFIPRKILLAWPQFRVDDQWVGIEDLFGSTRTIAEQNLEHFTNNGESLFDAVSHVAIDFDGKTAGCGSGQCDLSRFVLESPAVFPSRDALFATQRKMFQHTLRGRIFEMLYGGRKSV